MAGGQYKDFEIPKQLLKVNGEVLIERTIRLLKENNIKDIAISTNNPMFDYLNVEKLRHKNTFIHEYKNEEAKGWWLDAFYPIDRPVCYLWGDVYFSEESIKTIIKTKTDDIEFFASAQPFAFNYPKQWVEPFALKVENTKHLHDAIEKTKQLAEEGKTWRKNPIVWELWTVIKNAPLQTEWGKYSCSYSSINDYTSDIDNKKDILILENILKLGGNEMVKCEVIERFTLGDFNKLQNIKRKAIDTKGTLYVGDTFDCDEEMAKYLSGGNSQKKVVVKVIEVMPKVEAKVEYHDEEKQPEVSIKLETEEVKEIAKQVNKAVKKSKKSKK